MKDNSFVVAENDGNKIFRVGLTEDYNNLLEDGDELVFGGTFLMHYPSRQIVFDILNRTIEDACNTLSELRNDVINAVTEYNMKWYYANVNFEKYAFECIERVNGKPRQAESRTIKKANTQTMEEIISYLNIGRGERWCDKNNKGYMEPYTLDDIQHGVPDGDQLCYVIINDGMRVYPIGGYDSETGKWHYVYVLNGLVHDSIILESEEVSAFIVHRNNEKD